MLLQTHCNRTRRLTLHLSPWLRRKPDRHTEDLLKLSHSRHSRSLVLLRLRALVALPVADIIFVAPGTKRPLFVEDAAFCTSTNITVSLASYASGADRHSQVLREQGHAAAHSLTSFC